MEILIFLLVSYILLSISLMKVFEKAGEAGWKGLVPGLNFVVWARLIGRKPAYAALLLVPIVNIFIYAGMCVDLVRSFGKYRFWHSALAVIYAPVMFFWLGWSKEEKYLEPILPAERAYFQKIQKAREENKARLLAKLERNNPYRKGPIREWVEAIVFAVFAAAFIRLFLIEAYTIPTSSMEDSLLVGDFLFVSKAHYGIRTPQTVLMVPLLHNRIPGLNTESYIREPSLPYFRLPALESIDHNEPVVFNYPEGDSVYVFPERTWSIYDYRRGTISPRRAREITQGKAPLVVRPVDKKDHYIKRCIGLPGDTLQIIDKQVYLNGKPARNPEKMEFRYIVKHPGVSLNLQKLEEWGVSPEDQFIKGQDFMILVLTKQQVEQIKSLDPKIEVIDFEKYLVNFLSKPDENTFRKYGIGNAERMGAFGPGWVLRLSNEQAERIKADSIAIVTPFAERPLFPYSKESENWTVDNYGPIWIPKKGATIQLTPQNLPAYRRVIAVYEGNDLEERDGKIFINGQETDRYTFRMNYYWMMGDNRHNSEDSRVWGFVPEDHIVGKPLFIFFSTKYGNMANGIRWERIFSSANPQ